MAMTTPTGWYCRPWHERGSDSTHGPLRMIAMTQTLLNISSTCFAHWSAVVVPTARTAGAKAVALHATKSHEVV